MLQFRFISLFILFLTALNLPAQELFPLNEPASSLPKNTIGARIFSESYKELDLWRHVESMRIMYGISAKLTVMGTLSASNHHGEWLPSDLITHIHIGNNSFTNTNNIKRGQPNYYRLNGVNFYSKYRFLTLDDQNKHLRMAIYGEYSLVKVAHDEAEPNLMDDNKGYGAGLITTWLYKKLATSVTLGFIKPGDYSESRYNSFTSTTTNTLIKYGEALKYNLSLGYLVYPKNYSSYKQTNFNIYLELMGKSYRQAKVIQDGENIKIQSDALKKGNYMDIRPGIQTIINSNLRIDFSLGLPFINKSYVNFYPSYFIAIQRYFYLK